MNKYEATIALTKIIAPKNRNPDTIKKALLSYDRTKWEAIVAIANQDGLIPLLYQSLKQKSLLQHINDIELLGYLEEFYKLNKKRNEGIVKQLQSISKILIYHNITPVFLKGAAALSEEHYPAIGSRIMTDIDIYIPHGKILEAIEILRESGYTEIEPDKPLLKDWHDYRRMYRKDMPAAIELHRLLLNAESMLFFPHLKIEQIVQPSKTLNNAYVLTPEYELYHSFLHSQISDLHHIYAHIDIRHQQHFAQIYYIHKINIQSMDTIARKKQIEWEAYKFIQNNFFDANMEINPQLQNNSQHYLNKVKKRLQNPQNFLIKSEDILHTFSSYLNPSTLQIRYQYKYKMLYIIYFPYSFIRIFIRYIFQTKTRKHVSTRLKMYK
jgi:hypothetical protein